MPSRPLVQARLMTRDKLARFLKTPEDIRAFEALQRDVVQVLPDAAEQMSGDIETAQSTAETAQTAADDAQTTANGAQTDASSALSQLSSLGGVPFITLAASGLLANERVLTAGANVVLDDAGGGGALTVRLADNPAITTSLGATALAVSDDGTNTLLSFFGAAPVLRPTAGIAAAAFAAGAGTPVLENSTFGGYTLGQVVAALKALGLLA